ncbi:MAG: hypothetical protein LCH84_14095 [Gemmatimonadetes bacterium]|nr:hypothetical protein [Gemmatimonadota bacterium]
MSITPTVAPPSRPATLPWFAHALRALALVIAVLGVIDPAVMRARRGAPVVALVTADSARHARRLDDAARVLRGRAAVVRGPVHDADVVVVVGDAIPSTLRAAAGDRAPVVVYSSHVAGAVRVREAQLTARTSLFDAAAVDFVLEAAMPTRAVAELLLDDVVVARDTVTARAHGAPHRLTFVPTALGVQRVQLRVHGADTARVDLVTRVDSGVVQVLAWDARPSWLATFVRRALARDPRLAVRSRVVTSRDVSRATRGAPASVRAVTSETDVVLVGAPDALSATEASALAELVRRDGVALVVLPDGPAATPLDALVGHGAWVSTPRAVPALVAGTRSPGAAADSSPMADTIAWRGVAIGTPRTLPAGATVLARLRLPDGMVGDPVVWRTPVGQGEVLVSGVFDAWRLRDATQSTFTTDWPALVLELAARRVPPLRAMPAALALRPGERTTFTIEARDPVLSGTTTGDSASSALRVTLEPVAPRTAAPAVAAPAVAAPAVADPRVTPLGGGRWQVAITAPADSGRWQLVATNSAARVAVPMLVGAMHRDVDEPAAVLAAWATAHGGRVVASDSGAGLFDAVRAAQRATPPRTPWHPMRSPWWIAPFALALAGDWWLRRRRGWP